MGGRGAGRGICRLWGMVIGGTWWGGWGRTEGWLGSWTNVCTIPCIGG